MTKAEKARAKALARTAHTRQGMAFVIDVDGTKHEVYPKNGRDFSLEELKEFIGGGYIEVVNLGKRWMVVDDDGIRKELPINEEATILYRMCTLPNNNFIYGPALVCEKYQIE